LWWNLIRSTTGCSSAQINNSYYPNLQILPNLITNSNCYGTKTCYTAASDGNFIYAFSLLNEGAASGIVLNGVINEVFEEIVCDKGGFML